MEDSLEILKITRHSSHEKWKMRLFGNLNFMKHTILKLSRFSIVGNVSLDSFLNRIQISSWMVLVRTSTIQMI